MTDINNRVQSIKHQLENMINNLELVDAKEYLQKYKEIIPEDRDIISFEIVIQILEGNLSKAEELAINSLQENPFLNDIIFNLGYIKELKGEYQEAYDLYMDCHNLLEEKNNDLEQAITRIKATGTALNEKNRMVFFCKQGLDSFLDDIIEGLSSEYRTKKIIVTNFEQIDIGMKWSDFCWFEWCDELVIYASSLPLAMKKKIICRIHGYEVYTDNVLKVNWDMVDQLIIVTPHIKRVFREKVNDSIIVDKVTLIYCGVDEKKYPFHMKTRGYNIGYLGFINFKKNIPLTLKIFHELYKKDNRYTLNLAGTFQDERTMRYVEYFIKENGLEGKIIYEGWKDFQEKLNWFEKIDYMLIASIDEGLCYAAAESMLSGIKPILHNCEGIKDHYDNKFIYNSVNEAIEMITSSNYNSYEYRSYIKEKYSLEKEIKRLKDTINSINFVKK